jgi:hypothetical protein
VDRGRFASPVLGDLGVAGLFVGKRCTACTSQVCRWGGGQVLGCRLISAALRVSLRRWMLLSGASVSSSLWWIALWVVASRSAIQDLVSQHLVGLYVHTTGIQVCRDMHDDSSHDTSSIINSQGQPTSS